MNIILHSIIVIYISSIRPGRYGYRKHPFFFITVSCSSYFDDYLNISNKEIITFVWQAIFRIFRKKKDSQRASEYDGIFNHFIEPVEEDDIGIQFYDLQKSFGYFTSTSALKNINLNILKGEITVILGHNGAGKSTLLNVICGELKYLCRCTYGSERA